MTPEQWRLVTAVFHAALARSAEERSAFVTAECSGDATVRREVDAMLAAHDAAGWSGGPVGGAVSLTPGARLGAFEIVSMLGAGGMGEVYRARDTKLHRDIAVKVLPAAVANDRDRLSRFANEARVLAALNHTNIAQVHGLEELSTGSGQPSIHALVMELVEGGTLADRIRQGRLPLDEALGIARQIAEALEAAHDHGIVHRDLKPANIAVRPDGLVKVLDFGLAKAIDHRAGSSPNSESVTAAVTEPGTVVGTAAYMAPEQAKGRPVDRRVDIWAFGCVLFEMLTGRRAFDDGTLAGTLLRIVSTEPDWQTLPADTPTAIRTLLRRCLEKDPRRRLDSAAVARLEIEDLLANDRTAARETAAAPRVHMDHQHTPSTRRSASKWMWPTVAAAVVLGSAALWLFGQKRQSDVATVPRLENARQLTTALGVENYATWSPDSKRIAYQASDGGYGGERDHDIWVAQLGQADAMNLTKGAGDNAMPSWSPDGQQIAFFSNRAGAWGVYLVAAIGGSPRQVLPLPNMNPSNWSAPQWSRDGAELHVSASEKTQNVVTVVSLATLQTRLVTLPDHDGTVVWDLSLSPDGSRYAYVSGGGDATEVTQLWTIPASGGTPLALTDGYTNVWSPTWSNDGRTLFYVSNRGGSMDLWQQSMTADGTPAGAPVAVTQGLGARSAAFSPDGSRLVYSRGAWVSNVWSVPILPDRPADWNDAKAVTSEHAFVEFVDASPDGTRLAVSSDRRGNQDLWVMPIAGGEMTQLTTDRAPDWNPRWSPDGREIAFYSFRSGNRDIWVMPSAGGPARQLTSNLRRESEPSWSPDGREIAFRSRGPQATWVVDAKGGAPRLVAEGFGPSPEWSPDGTWLLLTRRGTLFRAPRDGASAPTPIPLVPRHAELQSPRFSKDGRFIYYAVQGLEPAQNLWQMSMADGHVSPLTQLHGRRGVLGWNFSVTSRDLYFTWREDDGDIWVMDVVTRPR